MNVVLNLPDVVVHTGTGILTMVALKKETMGTIFISKADVVESFTRSRGPGGQHVNKTETCVQLLHQPSGMIIKCQEYKSQYQNRAKAWELLQQALNRRQEAKELHHRQALAKKRRQNRKRSDSAKERMLQDKKKHSLRKKLRKGENDDD